MDATVRQSPVLAQCFEGYHCLFDIAAGFQNNFAVRLVSALPALSPMAKRCFRCSPKSFANSATSVLVVRVVSQHRTDLFECVWRKQIACLKKGDQYGDIVRGNGSNHGFAPQQRKRERKPSRSTRTMLNASNYRV